MNQYAHQENTPEQSELQLSSIPLEHISVSQLLGRDYIFIDTQAVKLPSGNSLQSLLSDAIQRLELAESQAVVVTIDESNVENPSFMRHDLTWHRHEICRIDSIAITLPEQYEFMKMIWYCSSAAVTT